MNRICSLVVSSILLLGLGCDSSTLADCDDLAADAAVDVYASNPLEFRWEGASADEVVVSRTGDGVEVWNIYVDSDDPKLLNQIESPVAYGDVPSVSEGSELIEAQEASELELDVEYQVQVFIQCDDDSTVDLLATWTTASD